MPEEAARLLERLQAADLRRPKTLTVAITRGCNLACGHCLVRSAGLAESAPVPAAALRRLVRDFAELGGEGVVLTGGEPLSHPKWRGLVSWCCEERRFHAIRVQTNAVLLTPEHVEALASLGCERLSLQVSLEGARPETHDLVRGAGSFIQTLRGLRFLAEGGLAARTRIAFTEMRHNVGDLPEVLALADRLGIAALTSGSVVLAGRAAESADIGPPEPSQYAELLRRYHEDAEFRSRVRDKAEITALAWWEGRAHPDPHVCNFVENLYVAADGRVFPCPLFQADELAAEGCYDRPLAEVLGGAVPLWKELKKASVRRREGLEPCRECTAFGHCRGGCMGRAHAAFGDPMATEDRCDLRRAVYGWKPPTPSA